MVSRIEQRVTRINENAASEQPDIVFNPRLSWPRKESIEHLHHIYDALNIKKQDWLTKTGFNDHQYYRWHNVNGKVVPSGLQMFHILSTLEISPNYMFFQQGPIGLTKAVIANLTLKHTTRDMIQSAMKNQIEFRTRQTNLISDITLLKSEVSELKSMIEALTQIISKNPP